MVDTAIAWSHAATASPYLYHIFPVIVPSDEKKTGSRRFSRRGLFVKEIQLSG